MYSGVSRGVLPFDLGLFLLKGVGLGTIVGWLCCHYGLQVKSSPTEVPQKASRAVVMRPPLWSRLQHVRYRDVLLGRGATHALSRGPAHALAPRFREIPGGHAPPRRIICRLVEPDATRGDAEGGLVLERATFSYGDLWVLRDTDLARAARVAPCWSLATTASANPHFCSYAPGSCRPPRAACCSTARAPHVATPSDLVRKGVRRGVLFDSGGLLSNLSALNNVTLALRYHADIFGSTTARFERRARAALSELRVAQTGFFMPYPRTSRSACASG